MTGYERERERERERKKKENTTIQFSFQIGQYCFRKLLGISFSVTSNATFLLGYLFRNGQPSLYKSSNTGLQTKKGFI